MLEEQLRNYRESNDSRAQEKEHDDAQAYRNKEVRSIIERSRYRDQQIQTVQDDVISEYEKSLEE